MYDEKNNNNILNYVLGFIILILVGLFIYLYIYHTLISKEEFKKKYTKNYEITFSKLPYYIQSLYMKKDEHINILNNLKLQNNDNNKYKNEIKDLKQEIYLSEKKYKELKVSLNNEIKLLNDKITKLKNKIKNLRLKKENTLLIDKKVLTKKDIITKKLSYKTLMCSHTKKETSILTNKCINKINNFAKNNKTSKYFEVMGFLSKNEYKNNEKLKLKLSKARVKEGIWELRKALDFKNKVQPVNYTITSKYNQKGIIIRAYY